MKNRITALALASSLLLLASCGGGGTEGKGGTGYAQAADLMEGIEPSEARDLPGVEGAGEVNEFAVKLLQNTGEATRLVSPLSVLSALGMCANGAAGETLAQLEAAFGLPLDSLNILLYNLASGLPNEEGNVVHLANSIWIKDDPSLTVEKPFLQANADFYGAAARKAPFDENTLKEINDWVNENTDGMIKDILDDIPPDAVIYLVNALCFDAEWDEIYHEDGISEGEFTTEAGDKRTAEFMYSEEQSWLSGDGFQGFLKPYKDGRFAFMALLPEEGTALEDFVQSLTGDKLTDALKNESFETVNAAIPKFEAEYSTELSGALQAMGIVDLFGDADLSRMGKYGDGDLSVSRVLHKTYISVNEKGTRAGAATAVEVRALSVPADPKEVVLDRPFVYGIIDLESNTPLFLGTLTDIQ